MVNDGGWRSYALAASLVESVRIRALQAPSQLAPQDGAAIKFLYSAAGSQMRGRYIARAGRFEAPRALGPVGGIPRSISPEAAGGHIGHRPPGPVVHPLHSSWRGA